MPKAAKKSAQAGEKEVPFEEALHKLEGLVQQMESEQMPLDQLISNYEGGTQLFQICQQRLDEAQGRVEMIRKKRDGTVKIEPVNGSRDKNVAAINEKTTTDLDDTGAEIVSEATDAVANKSSNPIDAEDAELF